ncbi:MAG: UDP-galactopyranose mutase [Schwartzia sp.]|nr:UDP-galactopyranose mutase [Schwartzia sp. (in: firmicutes)]
MRYDYIIVGSGLYGSVFAHEAARLGHACLVVERRPHVGGNVYCEMRDGIPVHMYGAHIFHTSSRRVWEYVNQFVDFNGFVNSPVANYRGKLYNLPFNMNTFHEMWGVVTPDEAEAVIARQRESAAAAIKGEPKNLEEQAILLVGTDIYETLIKGYTEKQWGRPCSKLPAFIIRRLPVRLTYDNNYFNDRYQGIPIGKGGEPDGYNSLIGSLLDDEKITVERGVDFLRERGRFEKHLSGGATIIYTGAIDEYFGYDYGELSYRGLRFEMEKIDSENYQGVAAMNFTDTEPAYTRIIEHRHFLRGACESKATWITREYPAEWRRGDEAYYPVNDEENKSLYEKYRELAKKEKNVVFGGRLGEYRYYDMDKVTEQALDTAKSIL